MATMTATNQQYYASYPVVQNAVSMTSNASQAQAAAYHHHHHHHHHPHHHPNHQQVAAAAAYASHRSHHQQMQPSTAAVVYQQHHPGVGATMTNASSLTPIGQTNQRTVSANSSSAATTTALYSIEATKSTKGASKLRRDLINTEIAQLRELLPLPASTRQRLSQLQLMALVLVYVRKSNYFCNAFRNYGIAREPSLAIPTSGFSKALNGFLMMLTQKGKLLYISDNAAEYLGHSMEDLLSHGDEVYDIIEDQDKKTIRTELLSNDDDTQTSPSSKCSVSPLNQQSQALPSTDTRIALCRMNVSRNARRQMRFGDQKVVLIEGHYFGFLPLSSRDEPVFLATCTPIAMPETRECVVQGSTNVFTSIHSMDMKFLYIDGIGEHHLGCTKQQIHGTSWYELVHVEYLNEAQIKHKRITTNDQERSTIALLRLMNYHQTNTVWIHSVMQVKEATDNTTQPVIVCTNQVLSEREAQVMRSNSWLYQFYSLHSKMHCNYSANSPLNAEHQTSTPNSVCSDSEDRISDIKSNTGASTVAAINTSSTMAGDLSSKSPPANLIEGGRSHQSDASPIRSDAFVSHDKINGNSSAYATNNCYPQQIHPVTGANANNKNSKLSPLTHSPSSSSTISSSPLSSSSYSQQTRSTRYHQLTTSGIVSNSLVGNQTTISDHMNFNQQQHHQHYQQHQHQISNSLGSSSASSTSSSSASSTSSTSGQSSQDTMSSTTPSVAQSMAAVAAAGNTAASLYAAAGIDAAAAAAIDPLQHMHHSHHHSMYSTATNQHASHHHAAAAVNYANQVMAAQRVAHQQSHHSHHHHHHHPYHPYSHHQHHHPASAMHHQSSHVAPHHHNHHTNPHAAASLYAPAHHHVAAASAAASTVALNSAFGHHHPHHAAYHSAAAVAAASAGQHHSSAHHSSSGSIQMDPYHSAGAAAAAAVAHQGVSFHYNKIAAAVNASA